MTANRSANSPKRSHPDLGSLPEHLASRIRGQAEVLDRLVRKIERRELRTIALRGCRGRVLLIGPTGTGKTELALALSEFLFGPSGFARFDCSEFKTKESIMALLGNREGDRGRFGQIHAQVPEGVWLFDEIEKAHPEFVQLFLQMTDAGRITLANGDTLDFGQIYLFVTSNLGGAPILGRTHLPFVTLERYVTRCVRRHLSPELLARFGTPLVFRPLSREVQAEIAGIQLNELVAANRQEGRTITYGEEAVRLLVRHGFSAELGARPMRDAVEQLAGDAIAESLLAGQNGSGRLVVAGNRLRLLT